MRQQLFKQAKVFRAKALQSFRMVTVVMEPYDAQHGLTSGTNNKPAR